MNRPLLDYKGYCGSMEIDADDRCLVGSVQFITSAILYDGETVDDLEQGFRSSVDAYLESCARRGVNPAKPFSGTFQIRPGAELHRAAAMHAYKKGVSLNEFVRDCIKTELEGGAQRGPDSQTVNYVTYTSMFLSPSEFPILRPSPHKQVITLDIPSRPVEQTITPRMIENRA